MAHNLYKSSMAFRGETPWHKLGAQFAEAFTAAEAIEAAHLGYEVTKRQLVLPCDHVMPDGSTVRDYRPVDRYATVNGDTDAVLGIVGDRYTPLQNKDAFAFFDVLLSEHGARYETAGAIGEGKKSGSWLGCPIRLNPCWAIR